MITKQNSIETSANENSNLLTKNEIQLLIENICSLLRKKYIYPEVAEQICNIITEKCNSDKYSCNPSYLANQLLTDVQSIKNDGHLRVVFNDKAVQNLINQTKKIDDRQYLEDKRLINYGFKKVEVLDGNVGYLDIRCFVEPEYAGDTAAAAMKYLSNVDALIIDLRNSRGGSPSMVHLLCSYLFPSNPPIHLNTFYNKENNHYSHSYTLPYLPGKRLVDIDIYMLISKITWSAAEELCYNLKHLNRATLIGETTKGGAHPCKWHNISNQFAISIPFGKAINPITKTNWQRCGVEPHIKMTGENVLDNVHKLALEKLL